MTQGKEEDRAHEGKHLENMVAYNISRVHHHDSSDLPEFRERLALNDESPNQP